MRKIKLGELYNITSGGTPSRNKSEYYEGGDIPWVKTGDLKYRDLLEASEYITQMGVENSSAKLFPKNTVLIAMYGATIGACSILRTSATTNQACAAFPPIEQILPEYLYYFFKVNKEKIIALGVGGAQPNISGTILKQIEILVPNIDEQQKVVDILDKAQHLIDLRKEQIQACDELIKSQFIEMFGDTVKNEKEWEIKQLQEIGTWKSGGTPSRSNHDYFKGDIDWYSAGELNQLYLEESIEKITLQAIEESSAKIFNKGSMLVGMYDTAAFKMGILKKDSACNQACANVMPNKSVNIVWLYYNLMHMKEHFLSNRRGIRQKNLNLGMIKEFDIPVPPIELQDQFAQFVQQVDKLKFEMEKSLEELENNFNALMQKAFKGELF